MPSRARSDLKLKISEERVAHRSNKFLDSRIAKSARLSPRQLEVLRWTAHGKTSWETAVIMCCTEATVNYHLKQVFRKLDATNKAHAVSQALARGILADH